MHEMHFIELVNAAAGQVTKACNQLVIGITIQAVVEALELGVALA